MAALTDNEIKTHLLGHYTATEANNIEPVPPSQVGIGDKINIPDGVLQGINATLTNPHLYPQSARGNRARQALRQFWAKDCPFKAAGITWGDVAQTALRYLWRISLALPDTQVVSHRVLFGASGAKAPDAIKTMRNTYPAFILWTILFGADSDYAMGKTVKAKTISQLKNPTYNGWVYPIGKTHLQMAHAGYFLPLVHYWLRFMNIGSHSTLKGMMHAKIYSLVKDQKKRGKYFGVWSNAYILSRMQNGDLTDQDCNMCKGMFFPYAMMLSNLTKAFECDRTKQYVAGPEQDKLGDHANVPNGVLNLVTIHERER